VNYKYKTEPDQQISIETDKQTEKFDILVDEKLIADPNLIRVIMNTFPGCTDTVNQFLHMITHIQSNEYRFFYDKMAVFVKIFDNKYLIESYEAKKRITKED
jgi:hypothetical protein